MLVGLSAFFMIEWLMCANLRFREYRDTHEKLGFPQVPLTMLLGSKLTTLVRHSSHSVKRYDGLEGSP